MEDNMQAPASEGANRVTGKLPGVITINEEQIRDHLGEVVRGTVEQTLQALLEAEADVLCGARRYERTGTRLDTRAGHYARKLHTRAGQVSLKEMYLAGVSVRRVEDITQALWEAICVNCPKLS